MICQSCLRRLRVSSAASSSRWLSSSSRLLAGTGQPSIPAARGPPSATHEGPPAATSTSAAQPFSSQMNTVAQPVLPPQKASTIPASIAPAGKALKGMAFFKNKNPPLAMEDHEYPDWLWTLLDSEKKKEANSSAEEGDIYAKTRRQRRAAAKSARKAASKNSGSAIPQLPIEIQTIDLPAGDGTLEGALQAMEARDELTEAMRGARRKNIKENNFLTAM